MSQAAALPRDEVAKIELVPVKYFGDAARTVSLISGIHVTSRHPLAETETLHVR